MPIDYDRARETMAGTPGFIKRQSTVVSNPLSFLPTAQYIIETCRNDEEWRIFVSYVDAEGGRRYVLPDKVCKALWRHYEAIMTHARKERAKNAAATRKRKGSKLLEDALDKADMPQV